MGQVAAARVTPSEPDRARRLFFRLGMPSRRDAVASMAEHVVQGLVAAQLGPDQVANLTVALTEALSNAVVHGNRRHPDRPVLVAGCVEPGQGVVIDVRDFGPGFAVSGLVDPCAADRVLVPSGRGILLMRHLVDDVTFNARGNRVRLRMRSRGTR